MFPFASEDIHFATASAVIRAWHSKESEVGQTMASILALSINGVRAPGLRMGQFSGLTVRRRRRQATYLPIGAVTNQDYSVSKRLPPPKPAITFSSAVC